MAAPSPLCWRCRYNAIDSRLMRPLLIFSFFGERHLLGVARVLGHPAVVAQTRFHVARLFRAESFEFRLAHRGSVDRGGKLALADAAQARVGETDGGAVGAGVKPFRPLPRAHVSGRVSTEQFDDHAVAADVVAPVAVHEDAVAFLTVAARPIREGVGVPDALNVRPVHRVREEADALRRPLLVDVGTVVERRDKPTVAAVEDVGSGHLRVGFRRQSEDCHEKHQPCDRDLALENSESNL